jgi:peptidoglycan/xylan/chitin deacetylase (PgdA/CDA1 family)
MQNKFELTTSWDDGGILDLKIAGLLKVFKLKGTFYIIVDKVGKAGYMNWDNVKDLDKQGFEIGSHTMTHPADLKALYETDLHYEIQNSKDLLEAVLGHPVSKFCYPRGRYDERVREMVAKSGYVEARTTGTPGNLHSKDKLGMIGTIHIYDRKEYMGKGIVEFAKETIDRAKKEGGVVNIWGHSSEIERYKLWKVLEEVLTYAENSIR